MTVELRDCPDCGVPREFAQLHSGQARCPDAAGGQCPEWVCLSCGAGLLAGLVPLALVPDGPPPRSAGAGARSGGAGARLGRAA